MLDIIVELLMYLNLDKHIIVHSMHLIKTLMNQMHVIRFVHQFYLLTLPKTNILCLFIFIQIEN